MGIVNITPDSFSDGGLYLHPERAIEHGLALLEEGADILDLGAESTRPGSAAGIRGKWEGNAESEAVQLSTEEEQARLLPVIEGVLQARPDAVISVDTYKAETARAAVTAGAEIVNDVSGFSWDGEMAGCCARLGCGVVLMHTRGLPSEWKTQPGLKTNEVLPMVRDGLAKSLGLAEHAGVLRDAVVVDAGYGFGKRFDENYSLLARQDELMALGFPLLAGLSRKSFLTRSFSHDPVLVRLLNDEEAKAEAREIASIAGMVAAILQGASIVRVHRVRAALEAAAVADSMLAAQ